jgi:NAD(P)-dependent dehydrogenase (short-subunit alcohol dehydrogenase family)
MTRVVLVTGANRGIGQELARQLALRGDTVVLTARDLAKAERTAAALPGHEGVLARRLDVTDPASIEQVAADLDRRYGRLDVLVNNAAIHYDTWQQASTADLQVVREALEVNLLGPWQTSLTLLPLLRVSGGNSRRFTLLLPAINAWRLPGSDLRRCGFRTRRSCCARCRRRGRTDGRGGCGRRATAATTTAATVAAPTAATGHQQARTENEYRDGAQQHQSSCRATPSGGPAGRCLSTASRHLDPTQMPWQAARPPRLVPTPSVEERIAG